MMPFFVKRQFDAHPGLAKITSNMGWLTFDRFFQIVISLVVIVWLIRYLGPEQYGLLSYAGAFAGLFGAFSSLGLGSILVRDLVKDKERRYVLLGTAFWMMTFAGLAAVILSTICIFLLSPENLFLTLLVFICSIPFILNAFGIIEYWFQSEVKSKYSVISKNFSLVLMSIVKVALILSSASLVWFAIAGIFDSLIITGGWIFFYSKEKGKMTKWSFDFRLAKSLLKEGWPLILSALAFTIYMRIDQVIIGQMMTMADVGLYSVAVKLSEFGNFIPVIFISSIVPAIVLSKKNNKELYISRFGKLYDMLVIVSISIALVLTVFSNQIVYLLYGAQYSFSSAIMMIYAWSMVPLFLSLAMNQYFVIEKITKFALYTSVVGCVLNVILNVLFIPSFGLVGAAFATVISYSLSVLSILLFKRTRQHGILMLRSFNLIRVVKQLLVNLR